MASYNDLYKAALSNDQSGMKTAVDHALADKIRDKLINKTLEVSSTLLQPNTDASKENGNNSENEN